MRHRIDSLAQELRKIMQLCDARSIAELHRGHDPQPTVVTGGRPARRRRMRVRSTITVIPGTGAEVAMGQLASVELCAGAALRLVEMISPRAVLLEQHRRLPPGRQRIPANQSPWCWEPLLLGSSLQFA